MVLHPRFEFDAAIVGCGPAGAAAALTLAQRGVRVCVLDRPRRRRQRGEGLPPAATPLLHQLGLWDRFLEDAHRPSHGNRSCWGSELSMDRDFIHSPFGQGWHLDRERFDALLRRAVDDSGVVRLHACLVTGYRRTATGMTELTISCPEEIRTLQPRHVVDASGQGSSRVRPSNVRRHMFDNLIGFIGIMRPAGESQSLESVTLSESCRSGWWYAAPTPDDHLVVGYMTDRDLTDVRTLGTQSGWLSALAKTSLVQEHVHSYGCSLVEQPHLVAAWSSQLEVGAVTGWYAAGDAAATHDPLSASGIISALAGGIEAAHAIVSDERHGVEEYNEGLRKRGAQYLATWLSYYALERRWPGEPFWSRRHDAWRELVSPLGGDDSNEVSAPLNQ